MRRVKTFLENWGVHAALLPIFFVVHNYKLYNGLVSLSVAFKVFGELVLFLLVFFLIVFAFTRQVNKSLQLTTLVGFVFLFFGVIKDFLGLTLHAELFAKYSVLLPLLFILSAVVILSILKKKNFRKANLYQNLLLLLFTLIDVAGITTYNKATLVKQDFIRTQNASIPGKTKADAKEPDVYFLVFDSYPGTGFLKEFMQFDNSAFNQTLREKGFFVAEDPRSNYNRTAFSMASTLNMRYLEKVKPNTRIDSKDYAAANLTIKEAIVPRIFQSHQYALYNLSVFDLGSTPPIRRETFFTMPQRNVLLHNTLPERVRNDLLWHVLTGKYSVPFFQKLFTQSRQEFKAEQEQKKTFNKTIIDSVSKIPFQKTSAPKFVYAHFYLPHPPFFYDENGKPNDPAYILTDASLEDRALFLAYLQYTNKTILNIVENINQATRGQAVIILQSDHGFRDFKDAAAHPEYFFTNYSAFYFPDKDYSTLYHTVSNVNTFGLLFNKYFKSNIPLQKDSTIFLEN